MVQRGVCSRGVGPDHRRVRLGYLVPVKRSGLVLSYERVERSLGPYRLEVPRSRCLDPESWLLSLNLSLESVSCDLYVISVEHHKTLVFLIKENCSEKHDFC